VQRRKQRAGSYVERALRDLADAARNAEPVVRAGSQRLKDEQVERAAQQIGLGQWMLLSKRYMSNAGSYRKSIGTFETAPRVRNLSAFSNVFGLQCRPSMGDTYLGEFEQVVLLAILRLDGNAYAIPVREEIEARTGRSVARGALYTALDRLETKGCLRSRMSEPLPERGGRSRRYYGVTASGLAALRASRASLLALWKGVESRLEGR
jgi:PadR family transcriptional regulator, regulatory protein PadR